MNRQPVSSSRIANVGWENNIMQVQFHNGAIYNYYGVTSTEFQNFMNSASLGSALSRIDKTHRYERVF